MLGALLTDTTVGTDARVVAVQGWPAANVVATDIQAGEGRFPISLATIPKVKYCTDFWNLGNKLFCSTNLTFPAKLVPGDILNSTHLDVAPVLDAAIDTSDTPNPLLSTLTSLNRLRGHVSALHAGAFFHLFTEEQQTHIVRALAGLLSPEPGSMIVGTQSGAHEKGIRVIQRPPNTGSLSRFCHSWTQLWDGQVFNQGTVKVDAELIKFESAMATQVDYHYLSWSMTRL